jgi:PAS domain S-box-containing protein
MDDKVSEEIEETKNRTAGVSAVQEKPEPYLDLIEGFPLAIQIMATDSARLYVNDAFLELLGYETKEEIYAMKAPAEFVAPYEWDRITRIREARERGEPAPSIYDIDMRRTDGTIVPVQIVSSDITWDGKPAYQRIYIDLSERHRAAQELRESEARYRDFFEGSDLGIQVGSPDEGRIFANYACAQLFGYDSPQELLAVPRHGLVAEHDQQRVDDFHAAFFKGEIATPSYEVDGLRKDGSIVPVQVFARLIQWEGKDAVQRTYIDLTDRKRAEERLRQSQKMEVVGQLTGGIAHDFNNFLTVVLGNLELLDRRVKDSDLSRLVHNAINASRRGAELTQRLLAFSRKQTLMPELIDVNELVRSMSNLMSRTLGATIDIEIIAATDPWSCKVDSAQLESAILNLAINARDAMPRGGKLSIKTENRALNETDVELMSGVAPGEFVMISVSDTGTGMSSAVADRAIEPFFTTKEVGAGSGLGLSMVHGFISQSQGYVGIESQPGAGTTVNLFLPRSTAGPGKARAVLKRKIPESRGETILVVEDDPEVCVLTIEMLHELGYNVISAANGREAEDAMQRTMKIDLVFTDVVLSGGMSGVDIAERAMERIPGIKILYTSGYAEDVLTEHGQTIQEIHLVGKPFEMEYLARKVREILDAT